MTIGRTDQELMAYVAEDREQPGAAWSACTDDPTDAEGVAAEVALWICNGAVVRRVTQQEASEMLLAWRLLDKCH